MNDLYVKLQNEKLLLVMKKGNNVTSALLEQTYTLDQEGYFKINENIINILSRDL